MTKFIQELVDKLKAIKAGMVANAPKWVGQPIAVPNVDTAITALEGADTAIESAKDTLQQNRADGRTLTKTHTDGIYKQAVLLATGIHNSDPAKLNEYDIQLPADGQPAVIPAKGVIASIEHDDDGIGFKLKAQRLDNANSYEWQKGETAQANQTT
ncbi:MAG: hypothetical protein ABIT08_08295, partial [Bacteroidia bacterium]